jgi:AraC-like DNA-binding protein
MVSRGVGAVLVNPPTAPPGTHHWILWGRGRRHHVAGFAGPFSIKAVVRGSGVWETAAGRFVVDPASYLVLNEGQTYTITVDARDPVETFCVFFRRGFMAEAARALAVPAGALLVAPEPSGPRAWDVAESLQPHDRHVSPLLGRLHLGVSGQDAGALDLETGIHELATALAAADDDVRRQAARVPARRASTRAEVYRRLRRARDFMEGHLDQDLTLDRVARAACLSSFHFHRSFRAAFGETPRDYVTRRRLERARELLRQGHLPVTEVCLAVGFESLGSFSAAFHRRFGRPPSRSREEGASAPWTGVLDSRSQERL